MSIVVRVLSILGLLGYLGFAFFLMAMSGMSASPTDPWTGGILFLLGSPFAYLFYCFISSFRILKGAELLVSGVIAHLVIAPFIVFSFIDGEMQVFGVAGLTMAGFWVAMYFERTRKRN